MQASATDSGATDVIQGTKDAGPQQAAVPANAGSPAALKISISRMSTFLRGQTNAAYLIRVGNDALAGPTVGQVQVTVPAPVGLQISKLRGPGWSCNATSCVRTDVLAAGKNYPAITVLASVDINAPDPLILQVSVAGGSDPVVKSASDVATVRDTAVPVVFTPSINYPYVPMPGNLSDVVSVSATGEILALRKDGTVAAWGCPDDYQCAVPAGLNNLIAVAAGSSFGVGLRSDGTVVAWGPGPGGTGVPAGLTDVVKIAANDHVGLALRADGTVSAWGDTQYIFTTTVKNATDIVDVSAGSNVIALRSNGVPVAFNNFYSPMPAGITDAVSVVAGASMTAVIHADNSITMWADYGLPDLTGWSNVDSMGLGAGYCGVALKKDGSLAMYGCEPDHGHAVPTDLQNVTAVAGGGITVVLLTSTPPVVAVQVYSGGMPFYVDGVLYQAAQNFSWVYGSSHSVLALDFIGGGTGTRYRFDSWSDGYGPAHTISANSIRSASLNVFYRPQYFLTTIATQGGSISPASGWYDRGQVMISAGAIGNNTFTTFAGAYYGSQPVFSLYLQNPATVYAIFSGLPLPLSKLSVTPASGSGPGVSLSSTYTAAAGFNDLAWYELLVAAAPDGGGQPYCFVHYDVQGNGFWVYGDGGFFVGPVQPGTASGDLQNSLCGLNTKTSSVSSSGATVTLNANLVFKAAAAYNVYVRSYTLSETDSQWNLKGTWNPTVAPMAGMSQVLNSSAGSQRTYTMTYPDPAGFGGTNKGWSQFLIAAATDGGGQPFCFLHYDRAGNGLWMYSSDVGFFLGPVAPGAGSNLLSSSACSIDTGTAQVTNLASGFTLKATLNTKPPMSGNKLVFQRTLDPLGRDSGWVQTGTAVIP
ncbi:hypothetical protein [Paludibaculum fermentans]|uniref:hypothetical protein n=1 Tax=Paludibaculum fermentans TaxID=1473598 RepID=UPI003EBB0BA3